MINYLTEVEKAHRNVVKNALNHGTKDGHYFQLSFKTKHPAVKMIQYLKDLYPDEMTVVVQHQYLNLKATDTTIFMTLSFGSIWQTLDIPFDALTLFADPSMDFVIPFTPNLSQPVETVQTNVVQFDSKKKVKK